MKRGTAHMRVRARVRKHPRNPLVCSLPLRSVGSCRDPRHRRASAALALTLACGLVFLLLGRIATPASGQTGDPVADADQAVAQAQAEVDRVAGAYFDALQQAQQIDARIQDTQGRIEELRQRVADLKQATADRAVAAYKRTGNALALTLLDSASATDTARRVKVLDLLNTRDDDTVRELRRSQDDLSNELQQLDAAREQQAKAIERLRNEGQLVNAKLVDAQNQRQVAVQQQLEAQQQAEAAAAAAAAAAATTTVPPPAPPSPQTTLAPVPAGYSPTGGVHPQHNNPFLTCVRYHESSNNYQAYNPGGPAYGAYQFLKPTWNLAANHAGRGDLVGLDPRRASEYDQDAMAWTLYQWQGKRPWSADPC
jgi:TolA-binding protein